MYTVQSPSLVNEGAFGKASGGFGVIALERLQQIVGELARKPGHEKVRALIHELLVVGLGAPSVNIQFERPVPEVRGRLDALLGNTVFEFKRDLKSERGDAEEELDRYLKEREKTTGERYLGVSTDGTVFHAVHVLRCCQKKT